MNDLFVNASDLRQHAYCPRILYFRYVAPVAPPRTWPMERGAALQEQFERLEPRRTLRRYGLENAERRFRVRASDPLLHLTGEIDLLLLTPDRAAVAEFKSGDTKIWKGHTLQLTAYALLARALTGLPCNTGFILYHDQKKIKTIKFSDTDFVEVKNATREITELISNQEFPPPTPQRRKCAACEFKNFCGDIF